MNRILRTVLAFTFVVGLSSTFMLVKPYGHVVELVAKETGMAATNQVGMEFKQRQK